ncbi:hypothetical protein WN944_021234 [Citrus x changshan-huyou]|uniref:Uncharacterized protein n=1 Tax=Citrus x changshan-huyou TaxID=2935761 RepID=A0AAP0QZJ6_9ROSI
MINQSTIFPFPAQASGDDDLYCRQCYCCVSTILAMINKVCKSEDGDVTAQRKSRKRKLVLQLQLAKNRASFIANYFGQTNVTNDVYGTWKLTN